VTLFEHHRQKLEAFLLGSMENELISDGVLAQDINQASSFWLLREVDIFHSFIIFFEKTLYLFSKFSIYPCHVLLFSFLGWFSNFCS